MMKKWIAFLLAISCLICVYGCEQDQKNDGNDPPPYEFVNEGVTVTPGADAKPVLEALAVKKLQESAKGSCLGGVDGEDVRYVYSGFCIETFRTSTEEEIRWVVFTDDSVETQRGIRVGSTADEVKAAYGSNNSETESLLRYQGGGTELRFTLRDGVVIGIEYTVAE